MDLMKFNDAIKPVVFLASAVSRHNDRGVGTAPDYLVVVGNRGVLK